MFRIERENFVGYDEGMIMLLKDAEEVKNDTPGLHVTDNEADNSKDGGHVKI